MKRRGTARRVIERFRNGAMDGVCPCGALLVEP